MRILLGASSYDVRDFASKTLENSTRTFAPGVTVLQEGDKFDSVILVNDGWLSTAKSFESGDAQLIDFVLPGDVLDPATANGLTAGLSVTTITRVSLSIIPPEVWKPLLNENPKIRDSVDHIRAAQRTRFSERILRLGRGDAKTRIAYALLEFCIRLDALGQSNDGSFHIPLTQAHIGDFTGLSTVHVSRVMGRFKKDRIIETGDHLDIHIIDLKALSDIAGIDAKHLQAEIKPVAL